RRRFRQRGIADERVLLRHETSGGRGYLAVFEEIDVALDVFPWSGHTTACEAMWMGVPVITLSGPAHAQRMVASVLSHLELVDWIADTPAGCVELSRRAAAGLDRLEPLRGGLRGRGRAGPGAGGKAFTRTLEEAYRGMWRRWCARAKGDSI